jgi:hypothetical protein
MATITGPHDAPHGRVTITMERCEAEAVGRFAADALAKNVHADEDVTPIVEALAWIADGAYV